MHMHKRGVERAEGPIFPFARLNKVDNAPLSTFPSPVSLLKKGAFEFGSPDLIFHSLFFQVSIFQSAAAQVKGTGPGIKACRFC